MHYILLFSPLLILIGLFVYLRKKAKVYDSLKDSYLQLMKSLMVTLNKKHALLYKLIYAVNSHPDANKELINSVIPARVRAADLLDEVNLNRVTELNLQIKFINEAKNELGHLIPELIKHIRETDWKMRSKILNRLSDEMDVLLAEISSKTVALNYRASKSNHIIKLVPGRQLKKIMNVELIDQINN